MLLKTNNLKFIINLKQTLVLSVALLAANTISAQEIIEDVKEETVKKTDTVKGAFKAQKVDGVAAVVGDFIVLESDLAEEYKQLEAQKVDIKEIPPCELFGSLLERKLYAHHAIQDSVQVSDLEIRQQADYIMQQFLQETNGSMEKLLEIHKKEDEKSYRDEIFEIVKNNKLATEMRASIVDGIEITPEEVRTFFNKIPEDQRPTFGTELKVAQIVAEPKVSEEEKQKLLERLQGFKVDIEENGASFRSKVVLYGQDPGMKQSGYIYTLDRKKPRMIKEFRDVAFTLQEGEISDPFETDFGFHIIKLEKIRGQKYDVSHILLNPKVSNQAISDAKERLEKVRKSIVDGDITFAAAARESSDNEDTKYDGGQLINPETQDYNWELTRMPPELYAQIQDLKDNEVSLVLGDQDERAKVFFKLLIVSDRIDDHKADYAQDYLKIKELALNEKRVKAIEEWQAKKIMDTYIKISGKHRDCEFSGNWLKK